MTQDLFAQMQESIIAGDPDQAEALAQQALQQGVEPIEAINQGFVPGLNRIGELFSAGEMFLPDLMFAAEAMKRAVAVLEPEMQRRGTVRETLGRVVIGTIHGDIHEIGKNLVGTMLSASGFEVFDLGVDVPVERFIQKAQEVKANLIGISALLTTTMDGQRKVIEALHIAGLRGQVRVMVGGAPVTKAWAQQIGADGFSEDAMGAVELAKKLLAA